MKPSIPAHPHTERTKIHEDAQGRLHAFICLQIAVPSRVAAMLAEAGGYHVIQSAGIGKEQYIAQRARNWKGGRGFRPLAAYFAEAIEEGCDTPILIDMTPHEWHLVGRLCGKLNITPGQWFLACAAYNAEVEEISIDRHLATLTETIHS